jgi:hypothetical protein
MTTSSSCRPGRVDVPVVVIVPLEGPLGFVAVLICSAVVRGGIGGDARGIKREVSTMRRSIRTLF